MASAQIVPARRDVFLLLIVCAALYGLGLGLAPLANPDESRYGEIPREMLATGDFVTPRLDGVKYFEKPPLTYWVVAGCLKLFGAGEASARATPAIFATLGVLLTYAVGRRLGGRGAGWWAAVVQATSLLYLVHARILITDMVVSMLISATLFCFLLGVRETPGPRRRWYFYGLYASAAGATIAKGLIGVLLPGAVMFLWLLLFNQWRRLRPFYLTTGLMVFAAIAVPWHVMVAQRNPEWAWFYFVHEHWLRFTTTEHGRFEPWWYFIPILLIGLFPWTGFLWTSLRSLWRDHPERGVDHADACFPLVWIVFIVFFFSLSQSKLPPYILPVFPPLAWIIGRHLAPRLQAGAMAGLRQGFLGFTWIAGLLGLGLLVVRFRESILRETNNADALREFALLAGLFLLAGALGTAVSVRRKRTDFALRSLLTSLSAFLAIIILASPAIARSSTKDIARIVAQQFKPGDIVLHYHDFYHDFTYYARQTAGTVAYEGELELFLDEPARAQGHFVDEAGFQKLWLGPQRVYLILPRKDMEALQTQPGFHARVLAESSKHVLLINRL